LGSRKVLKQARLTGALEDYYASPIGVDGKVYIASEQWQGPRAACSRRMGGSGDQ
jgi:hypothetical protein